MNFIYEYTKRNREKAPLLLLKAFQQTYSKVFKNSITMIKFCTTKHFMQANTLQTKRKI